MIGYDFRLHTDRSALEGGEYVEIQTGPFAERYWCEGSVYVRADVFALIDGPLRGRCGYVDVYSTVDLDREHGAECILVWREAARQIEAGQALRAMRLLGLGHVPLLDGELRLQSDAVIGLLRGLADVVERRLSVCERIAVVGL
ncbi:hypothetical protein [Sinimarinibacterium thermocellulolyticum]|uniref:Uncharacterized protein n=1 Tax=Sinimarinibacterium thermocellulolyticum TaxID=3170016 RepID=A0ABV2ABI4_9GAMM